MPSSDTELLADLIRAKRSCLVQVRDMGRKQFELIDDGEMTALLDLLAAKQRLINQLQRIENALAPFRQQDPHQRVWRSEPDRLRCAEDIEQCESLLHEIISQERCGEGMLTRRRDEAAARLQGSHLASCAQGAYAIEAEAGNRGLDLLSEA